MNVGPVSGGDVDELLGHPVGGVDHVLERPVDVVLPPANHFPGVVRHLVHDLAFFELVSGLFEKSVSCESGPVLDVLNVDEVFTPSDSVVGSPLLA